MRYYYYNSLYDEVLDLCFRLKRVSDYIVIQAEFKRTQFSLTKLLNLVLKNVQPHEIFKEKILDTDQNMKKSYALMRDLSTHISTLLELNG